MSASSQRSIAERLYRSGAGRVLSALVRLIARLQKPFMVYGFEDPATRCFRRYVRMSSTVTVLEPAGLGIGDHVWVGHHTVLDASGGLSIGEGCQIGSWVGIFTHGTQDAIRLLGRSYVDVPHRERRGCMRKPVRIGEYTFVGAGTIILPGVTVGKGCIIGPNCVVMASVPDRTILANPPARVIGSTLDSDSAAFASEDFSTTYFDPAVLGALSRNPDAGGRDPARMDQTQSS